MSKRKQTLRQALREPSITKAIQALVGCRVGRWAGMAHALFCLAAVLPPRNHRRFKIRKLLDTALTEDDAQRYAWREEVRS